MLKIDIVAEDRQTMQICLMVTVHKPLHAWPKSTTNLNLGNSSAMISKEEYQRLQNNHENTQDAIAASIMNREARAFDPGKERIVVNLFNKPSLFYAFTCSNGNNQIVFEDAESEALLSS